MAGEKFGSGGGDCGGSVTVYVTTWCTYCGAYKNGSTLKPPWTLACGNGTLTVTPAWATGAEPMVPHCTWRCNNGKTGSASGAGCENSAKNACCSDCSGDPEKKYCACGKDGAPHCFLESVLAQYGVPKGQECSQDPDCKYLACSKPSPSPSAPPKPSPTSPGGKCWDPKKPKLCQGPYGPRNFNCCREDQECKITGGIIECVAGSPSPSPSASASPSASPEPKDPCVVCDPSGTCRIDCAADPAVCCEKHKTQCSEHPACEEVPSASASPSVSESPSPSASASATASVSPSATTSPTPKPSVSAKPSVAPSSSPSSSPVASSEPPLSCKPPYILDSSGRIIGCKCGWELYQIGSEIGCKCIGKVDPVTNECDPSVVVPCNPSRLGVASGSGQYNMITTTQPDAMNNIVTTGKCNAVVE